MKDERRKMRDERQQTNNLLNTKAILVVHYSKTLFNFLEYTMLQCNLKSTLITNLALCKKLIFYQFI